MSGLGRKRAKARRNVIISSFRRYFSFGSYFMRLRIILIACLSLFLIPSSVILAQEDKPHPLRFMLDPALSPDGKKIAFEFQGDIWTTAAEGGTAQRLTVHEAHDRLPAWSPDGRWMAFSSKRAGNYDVWVMPANGGKPKQLTFHLNRFDDALPSHPPHHQQRRHFTNP